MKPYNPTETKKDQIRRMFDGIAPSYDRLNHVLSFGVDIYWRNCVVKYVKSIKAVRILDVATGTGDLAIAMAKHIKQAQVTGVDISAQMIEVGQGKVSETDLRSRISLAVADAENLPFADNAFDAVTAAFGVRNFENVPAGLAQFHRVLKPGGSVVILEFGVPDNKIFGALFRFYFHKVLPLVGGIVSKDNRAYLYLPQSVDEFVHGDSFVELLRAAGFAECRYRSLMFGVANVYIGIKEL